MHEFRASAGSVDLMPPVGLWMSGYAARIFASEGTHDQITARALLLDDGETQVVLISCDLIGFERSTVEEIRTRIAERCGIPEASIIVACTHTHSGPSSMPFRGVLGNVDQAWLAQVKTRIVDLVASLPDGLKPAVFRCAKVDVPCIGFNRQDPSRGIDEEATIVGIDSPDGIAIATILNYGCHAVVLRGDNLLYSADYPGAVVRRLESLRGGAGLFLQGTIGDVDPSGHYDAGQGGFDTLERIGMVLADAAESALNSVKSTSDVKLGIVSEIVDWPLEPAPSLVELDAYEADQRAQMRQFAETGDRVMELVAAAMLEWASSMRTALANSDVPTSVPGEIAIVRINDLLLVTTPFELYSDIGIAIKQALKPSKAAFVGVSNGHLGYLATRWAKDQGGYGPRDAFRWSVNVVTATDCAAADLLVARARELTEQVISDH